MIQSFYRSVTLCYFNELQRKIFWVYEILLCIFCHISVLGYESRRVKCCFTLCISNWLYIRMHTFPKVLVVSTFLLVVSSSKMDCFSSIIGNEFFFKHYKIQWPILCLNLRNTSKPKQNKMHTNKKEKKEKKDMLSHVVGQFVYLFLKSVPLYWVWLLFTELRWCICVCASDLTKHWGFLLNLYLPFSKW